MNNSYHYDPINHDIVYQIIPIDPAAHLFKILLTIPNPDVNGQIIYMPNWIPGSYKIREFAKHITYIQAKYTYQSNFENINNSIVYQTIPIKQINKHSWYIDVYSATRLINTPSNQQDISDKIDSLSNLTINHDNINGNIKHIHGSICIIYCVYAYNLSVRTAYLDEQFALINFSSLCLAVKGQEDNRCIIHLTPPCSNVHNQDRIKPNHWQVITSLPACSNTVSGHFGYYYAPNYDALIDYPVQLAPAHLIQTGEFHINNAVHIISIIGHVTNLDMNRLIRDTKTICAAHIALFDPDTHCAPFLDSDFNTPYRFMTYAIGEGYGGLEHRSSTTLICKRSDLPNTLINSNALDIGYQHYLGLISHEYFHTWHIKRIKPANFISYDLTQENYTDLLWLFEGFTAYYDDLILVRTQIITVKHYLEQLSQTISKHLRTPARLNESVVDSSINAWIKYYNPDENSPNVHNNYYIHGSLLALYLDLYIRLHPNTLESPKSLDDVMRLLWNNFGKNFYRTNQKNGVTLSDIYQIFQESTGLNLHFLIDTLIHTATDIPLQPLIQAVGIAWNQTALTDTVSLGASIHCIGNEVYLSTVYTNEAAHKAGLSSGDCLIALDNLRVTPTSLSLILSRLSPKTAINALAWRRDELINTTIILDHAPLTAVKLSISDINNSFLKNWLHLY